MYTLKNDDLTVNIQNIGAEICSIKNNTTGDEYMWNANPEIWGSHAPVLFPIIGALKDNEYIFEGKTYTIPKHGFIRYNKELYCVEHTDEKLTLSLRYNEEYLAMYPFKFEFYITYTLEKKKLKVQHYIINHGDDAMYFSLGGHPAFKCPLHHNESYSDYELIFETEETDDIHLLTDNGLQSGESKPLLHQQKTLGLKHEMFENDALIFKHLTSKKIQLSHKTSGPILQVAFSDFDYVGIWAKPNGDFVCIEPWLGITDVVNTSKNFKEKEGILTLEGKKEYSAVFSIEIF
ncbi:aldose 1-epimerase family protein [Zhouia sp. PK063]|uniref:aldose 1-epimerase family protein n=1 Tax=Zhouia sp. PK063 TaxID=3373602 RepID=UPI0037A2D20B